MKNAKKVLFAMILSAPLSMFGMEEFTISPVSTPSTSRPTSPKLELAIAADTFVAPYSTSPKNDTQLEDQNAKAKKLGLTAAVLGLSTGLSFVAQAYDTSGATRNPNFVKAQYAGVAATVTVVTMAAHQAHKANPEFVNNVVSHATTSVSNVAISLKDLCTFKKAEQKDVFVVEPVVAVSTSSCIAAAVTEDIK